MIKPPSKSKKVTAAQADALANQLADKTYGKVKDAPEEIVRATISLPKALLIKVEDLAMLNKRDGKDHRNVSAIMRAGLELYLKASK